MIAVILIFIKTKNPTPQPYLVQFVVSLDNDSFAVLICFFRRPFSQYPMCSLFYYSLLNVKHIMKKFNIAVFLFDLMSGIIAVFSLV